MDMFQIHIYKEQAGSSIAKVSACALTYSGPHQTVLKKLLTSGKKHF